MTTKGKKRRKKESQTRELVFLLELDELCQWAQVAVVGGDTLHHDEAADQLVVRAHLRLLLLQDVLQLIHVIVLEGQHVGAGQRDALLGAIADPLIINNQVT